jgi:hypothetical protein
MQHIQQQYMQTYKWRHCMKQKSYFIVFIIYLAGAYEKAIEQTLKTSTTFSNTIVYRFSATQQSVQ